MNILLAREELDQNPKKVTVESLKKQLDHKTDKLFYFDKNNTHKQIMDLIESIEKDNYTVHFREIKYGLEEEDYMYELHVL
ncbi:MAG: hypothetical protein B1H07_03340 [Campylobacteraceae bacterium 4484_166]|nr:MAG: hypothetical protein B1H07_03340 [Campylobacteraceae bacterium 4484_166]